MSAEESVRSGDLDKALAELQAEVRRDPSSSKHRVFLFQLLAVLGQWERALNQLKVVGELDAKTLPMVQTYREAIRCELLRAEVFAGKRAPLIFGDPEEWMALSLEALRLGAEGRFGEAEAARARAFEAAPATAGVMDGAPFTWIADADPRLGPMLEAVVNGRYYWVPFQRLRAVKIEKPADLRDVVWMPAELTVANGGTTVALIPARYPGSEKCADDAGALRLSRKTEWMAVGGETYLGLGQRVLATDAGERALMDVRELTLDVTGGAADPGAGASDAGSDGHG